MRSTAESVIAKLHAASSVRAMRVPKGVLPVLFLMLHVAYGAGSVAGFASAIALPFKRLSAKPRSEAVSE